MSSQILDNYVNIQFIPVVPSKGSWLGHAATRSFLEAGSKPSQPQPDPCTATVAAVIFSLNASKEPKSRLIASANGPLGSPPPLGHKLFQKMLWLICPPPLNLIADYRKVKTLQKIYLKRNHFGNVMLMNSLGQLFFGDIQIVDICCMVFLMMDLHYLSRDNGL